MAADLDLSRFRAAPSARSCQRSLRSAWVRPISHSGRCDRVWQCDALCPGLASGLDDFFAGPGYPVREPVGAHVLADVFLRVRFRRRRRQTDRRDVRGRVEPGCRLPSGAVRKQNGVSAPGHLAGYFFRMHLHGSGIGLWQGKGRSLARRRTDGAKDSGVGMAPVGGPARRWPAPCLLPHDAVLPADAGLILKPDFCRRISRCILQTGFQGIAEVLSKARMVSASWPGRTWPCPDMGEAPGPSESSRHGVGDAPRQSVA